jgi:hypothetical protein
MLFSSGTAEERVTEEATGGGGNQTPFGKENTPPIRARRGKTGGTGSRFE